MTGSHAYRFCSGPGSAFRRCKLPSICAALIDALRGAGLPAAVVVAALTDTVKAYAGDGTLGAVMHRDRLREIRGPWLLDAATWSSVRATGGRARPDVSGSGLTEIVLSTGVTVQTVTVQTVTVETVTAP